MARFRWGNSSNDLIAIRVELQCAGAPIADKLGVRPMSSALSSTARIASAFQALCAPLLEHCLLAMTSAGTCRDQQGTIDIGISRSIDGGCSWEPMRVAMQRGEWGGLPRCFNGISDACILGEKMQVLSTCWHCAHEYGRQRSVTRYFTWLLNVRIMHGG